MNNVCGSKNSASGKGVALWLLLPAVLVAVFLTAIPPRAHATLTLQLSSGGSTIFCADQAACDMSLAIGAVTYSGTVGNFIINVSTAITYPALATPALPSLDLNSINLSSGSAGGNLTVAASQTGYTGTGGNFQLGIGGTTGGTVSTQAYLSSANALFGTTTLLGSLGPFTGAFSGTTGGSVSATAPFSLTTVANISHPGGTLSSSFNVSLQLPEPASLILLGSGLTILGLFGMRRARAKETDLP